MRRNILIVDDDKSFQVIASFYLEHAGYDISVCQDGHSALVELQKDKTDLILLDVSMPHMNGITMLRNLRNNHKTKGLPVIMVTSNGDLNTVNSAIRNGCNDIITKPIDRSVFLSKVQLALNNAPTYYELKFHNDEMLSSGYIELSYKIKSMSVRGVLIETEIQLPNKYIIEKFVAPYFEKIGLSNIRFQIIECVKNQNEKYDCFLKFVNTPESEIEKLRMWILDNYQKQGH